MPTVQQGKHGQAMPGADAANATAAKEDVTLMADPSAPPLASLCTVLLAQPAVRVATRQYWHSDLGPAPEHMQQREHAADPPVSRVEGRSWVAWFLLSCSQHAQPAPVHC